MRECAHSPLPSIGKSRAYRPASIHAGSQAPRRSLDAESRSWCERLHGAEPARSLAVAELHGRMRREAEFQIRDRVRSRAEFPRSDIGDLATETANSALTVLMRKLDDYRGESRFWTWARKFAALEAPVSIRRRVGHDRVGISAEPRLALDVPDPACSAQELLETRELLRSVSEIIANELTDRQRSVLVAIAVDGVSPQTLARELHTTTGAVYKALHDARVKLRLELAVRG